MSLPEHDPSSQAAVYYSGPDVLWERRTPEEAGIDPDLLQSAIAFATDPDLVIGLFINRYEFGRSL